MAARLAPVLCLLAAASAQNRVHYDATFQISDAQYYEMPALFGVDDYRACAASRHLYCLGSFELAPSGETQRRLYQLMQLYSSNWVDNYNHTRLHRGVCVSRRCPRNDDETSENRTTSKNQTSKNSGNDAAWFERCVNEDVNKSHNLSASLYQVEYCRRGDEEPPPPTLADKAAAGFAATLLVLAALSTTLDLTLSDHKKKGLEWALAWSARGCWRDLVSKPPAHATDLRVFDGLRVVCMLCVIVEHVCWLGALTYNAEPRFLEINRRKPEIMLLINSTLVVQIFFMMSSYLLAHKLLRMARARQAPLPFFATFWDTMVNRIIRVSPSYWCVVWFASTWWRRLGGSAAGPLWTPLVADEAAICRRKWWTHLLYLNNVIYPDDKCLIQTWYLAADMQLYAFSLALTLLLSRWPRAATGVLWSLCVVAVSGLSALAYLWEMMPTFIMHRPELVRVAYSGSTSFNVLYQSPLGNVSGALAGLLLAQIDHGLRERGVKLENNKIFRGLSLLACPLALWWLVSSPRLIPPPPARLPAALLAALERPVFALGVAAALLGVMHRIQSPWGWVLSWSGWRVPARLSFAALLLHMPLNKALLGARLRLTQIDHAQVILDWVGIAGASYLLALPLALLVELPCQRLYLALRRRQRSPAPAPPAAETPAIRDKTERTT